MGAAIAGTGAYGDKDDYIPHHEPFGYSVSTANSHHLSPASLAAIGIDTQSYVGGQPQFDTANHQYDMSDFNALGGRDQPPVSLARSSARGQLPEGPGYQDGHAGYSHSLRPGGVPFPTHARRCINPG